MSTCHNHQHCIDSALNNAENLCQAAGARLTPLRKQVLELIWQSHKPMGAYDLINMLADVSEKTIAPPTVYRALDFLLEVGLIHRINSLNAYIGCMEPSTKHPSYFLICTQCHTASECNDNGLSEQINNLSQENDFVIEKQWLEVLGLCRNCQIQTSV